MQIYHFDEWKKLIEIFILGHSKLEEMNMLHLIYIKLAPEGLGKCTSAAGEIQ